MSQVVETPSPPSPIQCCRVLWALVFIYFLKLFYNIALWEREGDTIVPTVFQQNDTDCSLFRAAIKDRDMCPLCNSESQSLSHMLFTCQTSSTIWNQFRYWWLKSFQEQITSPESVILYGWRKKKSNTWPVLNYTLIIAEYHIFATSLGNGSLDFEGFLSRLKSKLTVLRTIASRNHNLKQFTETWAAVL